MAKALNLLHNDRLFPVNFSCRTIARQIYESIKNLPIISPHGHTDPAWFADNINFTDAHALLIAPDHYLIRMLYSKGVSLESLGISSNLDGKVADPRSAWRVFAKNYYLFRGTPTGLWLNHTFNEVFGITELLDEGTADRYFDIITSALQQDSFRPRAMFDKFNIEFLATTESPIDALNHHKVIQSSEWSGRIGTSYRPDPVIDPEHISFYQSLERFGKITQENVYTWQGYLSAHRKRRLDFIAHGATSTDHGHPTPATANLSETDAIRLFNRIVSGDHTLTDCELFRAQMLTEMARMSLDDGLVMQIHPGSSRNP